MDTPIDLVSRRLRIGGICAAVMAVYMVLAVLLPHEVKRWPENLGVNDFVSFGLGLLVCLILLPVFIHGTNRQRMAAVGIGLFPTWVLYTEISRFLFLMEYAR